MHVGLPCHWPFGHVQSHPLTQIVGQLDSSNSSAGDGPACSDPECRYCVPLGLISRPADRSISVPAGEARNCR
jgi:hypothetical protein